MYHANPVNDLILLFALTFALYRVGDIWTFQVVLFPLWRRVRAEDFPAYHQAHFRSIFGVIFVPMGLSGLSAILLWFFPPLGAPRWLLGAALERFSYRCAYLSGSLNHAVASFAVMEGSRSAIARSSASTVLAAAVRSPCLSLAHAFSIGLRSGE